MTPSSSSSPTTTITTQTPPPPASSTTQACAACKYQRRKCQPDCTLAPYFPADQQRTFLNAHRLFGVSNILKTLRGLDPALRPEAMRSIIFHSNARAQDPVHGCCRLILDLHRQIHLVAAEIEHVRRQIEFYRAQQQQLPAVHGAGDGGAVSDIGQSLQLVLNEGADCSGGGNSHNSNVDVIYYSHEHSDVVMPAIDQPQHYYYYLDAVGTGGPGDAIDDGNDSNNGIAMGAAAAAAAAPPSTSTSTAVNNEGHPPPPEQQNRENVVDDVKPFIELFDDGQQDFFAPPPATGKDKDDEGSISDKHASPFHWNSAVNVMELKEEPNFVEHDLKGAASLFTLTNCNTPIV